MGMNATKQVKFGSTGPLCLCFFQKQKVNLLSHQYVQYHPNFQKIMENLYMILCANFFILRNFLVVSD